MANPAPLPTSIPHFGDLLPWAINTFYALGQRVTSSGNVYTCAVAGLSAAVAPGPSGAGPFVDNQITWNLVVAISAAWVNATLYAAGAVVTNGGVTYTAITGGTSAILPATGPSGTGGAIADGSVVWSYIATANAQQTAPTSRVGDVGAVPGSPAMAQYLNWLFAGIIGWLYFVRDLAAQAWTWTGTHIFQAAATFNATALFNVAATFANNLVANGPAGDDQAAITFGGAIVTRKLILDLSFFGTPGVRIYARKVGSYGIEITHNAYWNAAAVDWIADNIAKSAYRFTLDVAGITLQSVVAGSANWLESTWSTLPVTIFDTNLNAGDVDPGRDLNAGRNVNAVGNVNSEGGNVVAFTNVQAQNGKLLSGFRNSSATMGAGQAVAAGSLTADLMPFAWCAFLNNGVNGAQTITRGVNIASVSRTSAGLLVVTLQTAASNGLILIATSYNSLAQCAATPSSLSSFTIAMSNSAGAGIDANGGVVVFGY